MPEPGKKYDILAYRVQGERPDGVTVTRDYIGRAKAEDAARRAAAGRTIIQHGQTVTLPPLANIRITPSAPIRWLYEDPALARGPEDL
ncbi:hypothetical protein PP641_gp043 [Arthrobacter phage SilentRX]|uniref:Uncharacterized protein n=1 Tax=Arthrobacter phage SilentRX TaxID=2836091 RepID=A0A8F3EA23_9CAUD|nr:hypothetical protein PP641_gp043 [Arthrobacter phage SilentRX]QWY82783.1 hypothetical protein SEA_SILENTRX_43 [Arthrobacter phage SilentRX]